MVKVNSTMALSWWALVGASAWMGATSAVAADSATTSATASSVQWLFRYRLEGVDQQGLPENALASTLLSRLTVQQGLADGWSAVAEVDLVTALGARMYNDTVHSASGYPVVADPSGTELNQGYVQYQQGASTLKLGRQRLALGNERFVGSVGWRQNEQTFDALRYQWADKGWDLDYSYSNKVHRVFGDDSPQGNWQGDLHLIQLGYQLSSAQQLQLYWLELDFDQAPAMSSRTQGLSYQGKAEAAGQWSWQASLATQQGIANNPVDYRAQYWDLGLSWAHAGWLIGAEVEELGSDNGVGFSTPLATLHKFQGFADKFLTTPGQGVQDRLVKVGYQLGSLNLLSQYHWLSAAEGGADYGHELDLQLSYALSPRYQLLAKWARYDASAYATDTAKWWLQLQAKY